MVRVFGVAVDLKSASDSVLLGNTCVSGRPSILFMRGQPVHGLATARGTTVHAHRGVCGKFSSGSSPLVAVIAGLNSGMVYNIFAESDRTTDRAICPMVRWTGCRWMVVPVRNEEFFAKEKF